MKAMNRTRNMNEWYTRENTYCLFRLFQEQKKGKVIEHKDLNKLHKRFLKEIGAYPGVSLSMREKFAQDEGVILYNSSEDWHMLIDLALEDDGSHRLSKSELYSIAAGAVCEAEVVGFGLEGYMTFEEVSKEVADWIQADKDMDTESEALEHKALWNEKLKDEEEMKHETPDVQLMNNQTLSVSDVPISFEEMISCFD